MGEHRHLPSVYIIVNADSTSWHFPSRTSTSVYKRSASIYHLQRSAASLAQVYVSFSWH